MIGGVGWKGVVVPAALVVGAEIGMRVYGSSSMSLAAPSDILSRLLQSLLDGSVILASRDTLTAMGAGLALGGVVGLALGVLFGLVKPLDRLMEVTVEAVRPIPPVALLPIALLVFGFGYSLEIAVVAFACVWPIMIYTRSAISGVEPRLLEVSRALRLSPWDRVFKIVLPAALPRIVVAFRIAAAIALVVAVTVEIAINPLGLGFGILLAKESLQPDLMLAYLVWIGLVGAGLNGLTSLVQRRLLGRAALVGAVA
jgi:ABC-type nitrate/sulfonate/bicarbonate transport system permease component